MEIKNQDFWQHLWDIHSFSLKRQNKLSFLWRTELQKLQIWADMPKYKEKSKDFVVSKIMERVPEKIDLGALNLKISELLFERDYNTIGETIEEYRKSKRK